MTNPKAAADMGRRRTFRRDIEGLRGIAILLVIGYHAGVTGLTGGYIGVDVFFALSGYLITGLLVSEIQTTGRLNFREFYARRVRRLLPAAAVVLAATLIVGWVVYAPYQQQGFTGTAVATAAYSSNVWFAKEAIDYLAADTGLNPFLHTWSLAVEEQFYLVWPLLIALILRRRDGAQIRVKRLTIAMIGLAVISFLAGLWLTRVAQPLAFFSSPTRAWEFAVGGLGAIFSSRREVGGGLTTVILSWVGFGGILTAAVAFDKTTVFPGAAALLPVVGTVAVLTLQSPSAPTALTRLLSVSVLQWVGALSYSWYLWHWPVLLMGGEVFGGSALVRLLCVVASLLLAWGTFVWLEHPIRSSKVLARRPVGSLALAVCVTVFSIGLSWAFRERARQAAETPSQRAFTEAWHDVPKVYDTGCHLSYLATEIPDCTFGDVSASTTIVLFGDSHAAQWFPALERIALDRHWALVSLTKSACPAASVRRIEPSLGREYMECDVWRNSAMDRIASLHPIAVVVASANSYVTDGRAKVAEGVTAEQWAAGTRETLTRLAAATQTTFIINDTPFPGFDVPACLAKAAWNSRLYSQSCMFDRATAVNSSAVAAAARATSKVPGVIALDFTASICGASTCNPGPGGQVAYRDTHHLTTRFASSLAPLISAELDGVILGRGVSQIDAAVMRAATIPEALSRRTRGSQG